MARTPGSAQYTENISSTVTPEQKTDLLAEAARRGVPYAIIVRWSIDKWLAENSTADTRNAEATSSVVPGARKAS
jgi:hypothetical protein